MLAPNYFLAPMTVSYRRTSISKLHHTMARKPTDEAATCNLRRSLSVGKYGETVTGIIALYLPWRADNNMLAERYTFVPYNLGWW